MGRNTGVSCLRFTPRYRSSTVKEAKLCARGGMRYGDIGRDGRETGSKKLGCGTCSTQLHVPGLPLTLVCLEADIPRGICQVDLYRH